jgi:hypothetical protein
MKTNNLTGKTLGNWTVLGRHGTTLGKSKKSTWLCRCSCGKEKIVIGSNLSRGLSTNCGCRKGIIIKNSIIKTREKEKYIKIGDKYGKLIVIEETDKRYQRSRLWKCKCECGKIVFTTSYNLKSGRKRSCGCLIVDTARKIKQSLVGTLNPRWRFDLTDEDRRNSKLRHYNKNKKLVDWRKSVFTRDKYICDICNKNGGVNAHHKYSWDIFKDKRYDITNGITLCKACHKIFHKKYGWGNNTESQYNQFKLSKLKKIC